MDKKFPGGKTRAAQFRDEALAAMQMAEATANEAARAERLQIAMEWLKLAAEIDQSSGCSSRNAT